MVSVFNDKDNNCQDHKNEEVGVEEQVELRKSSVGVGLCDVRKDSMHFISIQEGIKRYYAE